MSKASEMLSGTNRGIANAYIAKTGLSEETILNLMNEETWLNAKTQSKRFRRCENVRRKHTTTCC